MKKERKLYYIEGQDERREGRCGWWIGSSSRRCHVCTCFLSAALNDVIKLFVHMKGCDALLELLFEYIISVLS